MRASIPQVFKLASLCNLCNQFHKGNLAVCEFCINFIKPLGPHCQQCAYPLPQSKLALCGQCIKKPPYFDNTYVGYLFEEPLRGLLHQFKYQQALYLGTLLSHLMGKVIPLENDFTPCLIPIPMHKTRIRQRGFNQAAILAKLLAKQFRLPYDLKSCKKIINTAPQVSLDGSQRQKNIRDCFLVSSIPYSHVLLIDDLLTTGSTANELARLLKKAGVVRVDVCCCARTVYH